jgi:hypothetical protein
MPKLNLVVTCESKRITQGLLFDFSLAPVIFALDVKSRTKGWPNHRAGKSASLCRMSGYLPSAFARFRREAATPLLIEAIDSATARMMPLTRLIYRRSSF